MAEKLLKKSYLHSNFKKITYDSLWNTKGVFTTIKVIGNKPKFIFLKEHISNLNRSLKIFNINFSINENNFKKLISDELKDNMNYNHLLRIAINNKQISISLRKNLRQNQFFTGVLVKYKRPMPEIKNLRYKKILEFLKRIKTNFNEVILFNKNSILEGCTTNIICVKDKKLYIPINNYYHGITLRFIRKYSKRKVFKENIPLEKLKLFDEILLVGSGKGIVALKNIPQIKWRKKSQIIYKELKQIYNSYIKRQKN
tara:strand:- start:28 stop:795 length:768 start_codon:yes stop_codon:yes gene_type:complete